jgi:hypothetical protein
MNAKPTPARPRVVTTIAAAALSTVIAIGLLITVTGLFQRDGAPFEQVVIAEHACANHTFISEREACVPHRVSKTLRVAEALRRDKAGERPLSETRRYGGFWPVRDPHRDDSSGR